MDSTPELTGESLLNIKMNNSSSHWYVSSIVDFNYGTAIQQL